MLMKLQTYAASKYQGFKTMVRNGYNRVAEIVKNPYQSFVAVTVLSCVFNVANVACTMGSFAWYFTGILGSVFAMFVIVSIFRMFMHMAGGLRTERAAA